MSAESASEIPKGQVDLLDFIDWSGVECLNQSSSHSLPNALKQGYREDAGLNLESDADEQLLIYIPFNQVVKLHSFAIKGPEDDGPKTVKFFSNKEHMCFSNVNDFPPSDTAELTEENLKGKPVVLKYVKFQNVRSLTIFIEDNQSGSELTKSNVTAGVGSAYTVSKMKPTSDKDVIKPITSVLSPSVLSALSNVQNGCAVQVLQRESRRETPLQLYNRFDAIQPRARPDSCRVGIV